MGALAILLFIFVTLLIRLLVGCFVRNENADVQNIDRLNTGSKGYAAKVFGCQMFVLQVDFSGDLSTSGLKNNANLCNKLRILCSIF